MSKKLEVWLIEAKDLVPADFTGKSDPYCLLKLGNTTKKSKIKYQTLNPKWKEKFIFDVEDETKQILEIETLDWDLLSSPDPLGKTKLFLKTLEKNESLQRWFTLEGVKSGEVHLLIKAVNFGIDSTPITGISFQFI
jgi:Ca2+-dependent lipid-binding protein